MRLNTALGNAWFSDLAGREHKVELTLPAEYPASPPTVKADLPVAWAPAWSGTATTLLGVYEQFSEVAPEHGPSASGRPSPTGRVVFS